MQEMKEQMATFIKRLEDEEYEYYYEEDDEAGYIRNTMKNKAGMEPARDSHDSKKSSKREKSI